MATADPILDLSTLIADRPPLRIDGKTYHLKSPDELSLAESHKFTRWGKELEELGGVPDKLDELEVLVCIVSRAALADVPDEVYVRLSPSQHLSIVEVFTVLLLGRRSRLTGAVISAAGRQTGPNSSRASNTSMAATQGGGSTPRPPHSSELT
jgi:hypothetical protein